jgi:hypothetical protein
LHLAVLSSQPVRYPVRVSVRSEALGRPTLEVPLVVKQDPGIEVPLALESEPLGEADSDEVPETRIRTTSEGLRVEGTVIVPQRWVGDADGAVLPMGYVRLHPDDTLQLFVGWTGWDVHRLARWGTPLGYHRYRYTANFPGAFRGPQRIQVIHARTGEAPEEDHLALVCDAVVRSR